MSTASVEATTAELSAAAEAVGSYQRRVGALAAPHLGTERGDVALDEFVRRRVGTLVGVEAHGDVDLR